MEDIVKVVGMFWVVFYLYFCNKEDIQCFMMVVYYDSVVIKVEEVLVQEELVFEFLIVVFVEYVGEVFKLLLEFLYGDEFLDSQNYVSYVEV